MYQKNEKVPSSIWAKDENGRWFHIYEGTGDNLLQEDVDEGYVDYLNYDYFEGLDEVNDQDNTDGGMILLKTFYQDMSVRQILNLVKDFEELNSLRRVD